MGERMTFVIAFTKLALFKLFVAIFNLCRNVIWLCNGTAFRIAKKRQDYKTSGHKLHIWYKYYVDSSYPVTLTNFILSHDGCVHPEYVLQDHVSLLQITEDKAIFTESDPDKPWAFAPEFGFYSLGQLETGCKIITMPLDSFRRLSLEMPENEGKILFIHNLSRAGSTLVSSVFAHTGRAIALSEPRPLDIVCTLYGKAWNESDSKTMLKDVIRILAKPITSWEEPPLLYAIKPVSLDMVYAEIIQELFPTSVSIFVYRDLTELVLSNRRAAATEPSAGLFFALVEYGTDAIRTGALSTVGIPDKSAQGFKAKYEPTMEIIYYLGMDMIRHYYSLRKNGMRIIGVRYEDLVDNPETMISKLLDLCEIPSTYVSKALKAMEKDSQENTELSRQKLAPFKTWYRSKFYPKPNLLSHVQAQYEAAGIPSPKEFADRNFRLPGSIAP